MAVCSLPSLHCCSPNFTSGPLPDPDFGHFVSLFIRLSYAFKFSPGCQTLWYVLKDMSLGLSSWDLKSHGGDGQKIASKCTFKSTPIVINGPKEMFRCWEEKNKDLARVLRRGHI